MPTAADIAPTVSNWRAVAESLPPTHVHVVPPRSPAEIAHALAAIAQAGSPVGALRRHFLSHYTCDRFLARMAAALQEISPVKQVIGRG